MQKPAIDSDHPTPMSPYLRRKFRDVETAVLDQARERGSAALQRWGKTIYLNVVDPGDGGGLYFNEHGCPVAAALDAMDDASHGYICTLQIGPSGIVAHHLAGLGQVLFLALPKPE